MAFDALNDKNKRMETQMDDVAIGITLTLTD